MYVQSLLSAAEMSKAIEDNKIITFPQSYAYNVELNKFTAYSGWNDMVTGEVIIRGENILLMQTLRGNPLLLELKKQP